LCRITLVVELVRQDTCAPVVAVDDERFVVVEGLLICLAFAGPWMSVAAKVGASFAG